MIEKKELLLIDLSEYVARQEWYKEDLFEECLKTISLNLFRTLPYQYRPPSLMFFHDEFFEKETSYEDPSWRHLKLIYDLTWRVISTANVTPQIMEKYMPGSFLQKLVELFASDDTRERSYLMMILHKIYARCLKLRAHIVDLMSTYLYRIIHSLDPEHFNGVIEMLQITCSIIPGLTVPVKDSWQKFLKNILVPLHKCRGLKKFWEQLTQCCVNFVAKDGLAGVVLLSGLLRYWPRQSPQKEEIFIMEAVNIINVLLNHQDGFEFKSYRDILVATARQLIDCMLSTRQPVAERAIAAWKEPSMQQLVDYDRKVFLPPLLDAFFQNQHATNQQLRQASQAAEKIYQNKDIVYWNKMQQYLTRKQAREKEAEQASSLALAYGTLPPFPFRGGQRCTIVHADTPDAKTIDSIRINVHGIVELDSCDSRGCAHHKPPSPGDDYSADHDAHTPTSTSMHTHRLDIDPISPVHARRFDSFIMFTLETINEVDYSPLVSNITKYEKDVAQHKHRYLTKSEQQVSNKYTYYYYHHYFYLLFLLYTNNIAYNVLYTRRRTNWALVRKLAEEKANNKNNSNTNNYTKEKEILNLLSKFDAFVLFYFITIVIIIFIIINLRTLLLLFFVCFLYLMCFVLRAKPKITTQNENKLNKH
ncbi:protein phosphatase 2a, regulatory subunit [Reticulomyxa filosa]|uniref:Protein phosphatase 2a, regulatory subunit n=1 Tax=Reticulomyxa filosa TaxID=46433 RepID=X6P3A8_RETFI|nr:protein phosphatase 2a, regulatory subunit [Reticulomyxa filosa]|eukprot:ETO32701.1 protein phosphatase 2a, regulatory subunit [Reticulomyxa filosa]